MLAYINGIKGDILAKEAFLKGAFALKTKVRGNFLLLDYNMIDSPKKHWFVDKCRGLVLRIDPETHEATFARRMFDRFYNYTEYPEADEAFDWKTAIVEEKVDGSIIGLWYNTDDDKWEVGTRGNAFGDNCVSTLSGEEGTVSFRSLFIRAIGGQEVFEKALKNRCEALTYMFELCTLENKIVTSYQGDTVFVLGIRENATGHYAGHIFWKKALASDFNAKLVPTYPIKSFEQAVKVANELPNLKEGFVLRDAKDIRIKLKSVAYVQAHHLRGEGVTPKRAILLALAGEVDEFCAYFPEFLPLLAPYVERVENTKASILTAYEVVRGLQGQKEFALAVMQDYKPFSKVLFQMRKGLTLEEAIESLTKDGKVGLFSA